MNSISQAIAQSGFQTIDFVILVFYLILLVSLGLFLSRKKDGKERSANDYFLAGNTLTWWAVGASLIAANISAEQFIGMSGTGFRDGIAIAAFGNSYRSDGAFLRYVATQPSLPGGAAGTAVMINGGKTVKGYTEHFITVSQSETAGGCSFVVAH